MKELKSICFSLLLSILPIYANAFDGRVEIDGIMYWVDTDNRSAGVVSFEEDGKYSGDIVIPSEIQYEGVTCSVNKIFEKAFFICRNLISIEIPNTVTQIGNIAFAGCSSLTSIKLPESITTIENGTFEECTGLTSIIIPNSVEKLGEFVFIQCSNLKTVTIPNSVTSIGRDCFNECNNITTIFSLIEDPYPIGLFSETVYANATLFVPNGTIDKYKKAAGWKDFKNIVESDPSGISKSPFVIGENMTNYDINGRKISGSQKGLIIQMNNGVTRKVILK